MKTLNHLVCIAILIFVPARIGNRIDIHIVDDLLMLLTDFLNVVPGVRIIERLLCFFNQLLLCGIQLCLLLRAWISVRVKRHTGLCSDHILIKGIKQVFRDCIDRFPDLRFKLIQLFGLQFRAQSNQTICKRSQNLRIFCSERCPLHKLRQTYMRFVLQRSRFCLLGFCDANSVNHDKMVLLCRIITGDHL